MLRKNVAFYLVFALTCLATGVVIGKVPEPGSKEDPLVTQSYVDWHAKWREVSFKSGDLLKLESGAEFVIIEPSDHPVHLKELNLDDTTIVDLTEGSPLTKRELTPLRLYIVASNTDARITFDESARIYVRGLKS